MKKTLKTAFKKTLQTSFIGLLAITTQFAIAQAQSISEDKLLIWEGDPIQVDIPLGKERRIDFPEPIVEFNIKPEHAQLSEFMLSPNGTLLWKPNAPYESIRTRAISMTGSHYIVDFSSQNDPEFGSTQTIKIIDPVTGGMDGIQKKSNSMSILPDDYVQEYVQESKPLPRDIPDFLVKNKASNTPDFVQITRFAMSHYTGSSRLIPKIQATVVNAPNPPRNWMRIFGDRVQTRTLSSWKIGKFYATSIMVRNISPMALEFDPRALRGSFVYSAMMNPLLQSKGTVGDEGLLVVISHKPFKDAVMD